MSRSREEEEDEYFRESTLDSSRVSESLNALIGQSKAAWSPNSIRHCESCGKQFTFRRRRHHCRKCGCLVCYKCSKHQLVLPRLDDSPVRVCNSCYNQVNCNPIEDLALDSAENSIAREYLSQILRVGIIMKSDSLIQAVVQGFSTAHTGTPLGLEVDVSKFPPRSCGVRFANSSICTPERNACRTTPDTPVGCKIRNRFPEDIDENVDVSETSEPIHFREQYADTISKEAIEQDQETAAIKEEDRLSETRSGSCGQSENSYCSQNSDSTNKSSYIDVLRANINDERKFECNGYEDCESESLPRECRVLNVYHHAEYTRRRAYRKAKAAYELYVNHFKASPDYSISIEMAFCRHDKSNSDHSTAVGNPHESRSSRESRSRLSYSVSWRDAYEPSESNSKGDNYTTCEEDSDAAEVEQECSKYYLFYWIYIWDGKSMRCGRSNNVELPPSVCSIIESPEFFKKLVCTETTVKPKNETDRIQDEAPPKSITSNRSYHTHYHNRYNDIDVEHILISLISKKEREDMLSSMSMSCTRASRSTLHNLPVGDEADGKSLPNTPLLTQAAGLIGWLSGGKVNRNKFLEMSIHMTMLPYLIMKNIYTEDR